MDARCRGRIRLGFTLVEMLVVVVIIGILAGMVTGAALMARVAAKRAKISAEVMDLDLAIKAFKERFGDYPPDPNDAAGTQRFLAKVFPRYTGGMPSVTLDPSTALVFWLGGMTDANGQPIGFSANPRNPFDNTPNTSRIGPFFDFDARRLQKIGTLNRYLPPNDNAQSDPYVYFRARYDGTYSGSCSVPSGAAVRPALDTRLGTNVFANSKSFQIRCCGLDGKFGKGISFPEGNDYDLSQYDDLSNFAAKTFGDEMQQ